MERGRRRCFLLAIRMYRDSEQDLCFTSLYTEELTVCSKQKLFSWWTKKNPRDALLEALAEAQSYEQWEEAAFQLDEFFGTDLWYGSCLS